jgi:hypothetical protein
MPLMGWPRWCAGTGNKPVLTYTYVFTHAGHTVEYRIMARNKTQANKVARQRAQAWRTAIEARSATHGSHI